MSTIKVDTIQKTDGSSKIAINALEGVDNVGQIAVRSDGGALFCQLQQGLCKQWANWNGATTIADSYNTTSATDHASGDSTMTIATAMVNTNFTVGGLSKSNDNDGVRMATMQFPANQTAIPSTTTYRIHCLYANTTLRDAEEQTVHIFGDLA
tara:strand:+ start:118 stop:576 length:459 start_codon:yes stop_codon:yes gene_type:complete